MSNGTFCILFLLTFFIKISILQKIEKRLSPIQIKSYEADFPSKAHLDQSTDKEIMNIKDTIKGKVVKIAPSLKPDRVAEETNYDSLDDIQYIDEENNDSPILRGKKNIKQWDHWGKWSDCSVSCGVGKMTRWRHCVSEGCGPEEKEAQIRTCALKPCP